MRNKEITVLDQEIHINIVTVSNSIRLEAKPDIITLQ